MQLYDLTATEAVRAMRAGEVSPVELVQSHLDRIAATEPRVQAWESVDAEGALAVARHLEARRRGRLPRELLFGLPVGIKDVFHARGFPTTANFDPYRDQMVIEDSGVVRLLRESSAIIIGKTVTAQFARGRAAPKTRNPWNHERSPGGSSSGSGAAVGARQVPATIGTQTGGSTLRPAAFCGVVGLKPTFGRISRYRLLPVSWSLDHTGIIVRSVADAALLLQALAHHDPRDPFSVEQHFEDFVAAANCAGSPPRLGLVRDLLDRAQPQVREATERAAQLLTDAGTEVREVKLPVPMDLLLAVHYLLRSGEFTAAHLEQYTQLAEHYEANVRDEIEVGQLVPAPIHVHVSRLRHRLRRLMDELVCSVDGIIGPTAPDLPGDPSLGTGNPDFQSIWTLFGFPNLTLPTVMSPDRLPHGMQIVGKQFSERALFRTAAWCEAVFGPLGAPHL